MKEATVNINFKYEVNNQYANESEQNSSDLNKALISLFVCIKSL